MLAPQAPNAQAGVATAAVVDETHGRAIVATSVRQAQSLAYQRTTVSTFDARTGSLRSTQLVGHGPSALAVDKRTGRVFVANYGDNTVNVLDIARL